MKVCVIGAGPAGLCMLRQLAAFSPDFFEITAFEAKNSVGGKWALSEQPFDKSPLAESFLTELPKECLYFPEFPFRRDLQDSFLPKAAISEYFQSYASYFSLYKYVKFNNRVTYVKPMWDDGKRTWDITTWNLVSGECATETFDVVIVAVGRQAKVSSYASHIESFENYTGSIFFNDPNISSLDKFRNKLVAIQGNGIQIADFALKISEIAETVFWCHDAPMLPTYLPENFMQKPSIYKAIGGDRLLLENIEIIKVDSLILIDSENFDFSFLSSECQIQKSDSPRLTPLYKQMIHIEFPRSLFFVGIPGSICKGIFFSIQSEFILRILFGLIRLPLRDTMDQVEAEETAFRLKLRTKPHEMLVSLHWDYLESLMKIGGIDSYRIPPAIREIYDDVKANQVYKLVEYRKCRYLMLDRVRWRCFIKNAKSEEIEQ